MSVFRDRADAGARLATRVADVVRPAEQPVILGLPRGGVPVAYEVARGLGAPLDVFLVRKLGVPGHEELAMGAIASGGIRILNQEVVVPLGIPPAAIDTVAGREQQELQRRERAYRGARPFPDLTGRTAVLIDDGLATGASMRAAIEGLRQHRPGRIVVAVPTAPEETCRALRKIADEIVCAETPRPFLGVGRWYEDFSQTTDDEVRELLQRAWGARGPVAEPREEARHG